MIPTRTRGERATWVALAIIAAACGPRSVAPAPTPAHPAATVTAAPATPPAAEPTAPKDPVAAAVEASVVLYEAIAALPTAGSCPETAATIDRLVGARAAALVAVRDAARGTRSAEIDGLFAAASERLRAAVVAIDALATRCAAEPAVATALDRLATEEPR